jgi:hypothetical protein
LVSMLFQSGIPLDSSVHQPLKFDLPTRTLGIRIFVFSTQTDSTRFRELSIIVNLHFLIPDDTKRPDLSCDSDPSRSSISSARRNPASMPGIDLRDSLTFGGRGFITRNILSSSAFPESSTISDSHGFGLLFSMLRVEPASPPDHTGLPTGNLLLRKVS